MLAFRDFLNAFRRLEIDRARPVIVHTSLSAFGQVQGGAETILGALMAQYQTILAPTFTYKTMVTPEDGPENNACQYGAGLTINRMAEFYQPDMRADRLMGVLPELLRNRPNAQRSTHPVMSFSGINAEAAIKAQSLDEPLAPLHALRLESGWVLLLGVNQTVNTSIHYAERLSGRKQFTRWALTPAGVVEFRGFPGCSDGFESLTPYLEGVARYVQLGPATITAVPLDDLTLIVRNVLAADELALLCKRPECERCNAVRTDVVLNKQ